MVNACSKHILHQRALMLMQCDDRRSILKNRLKKLVTSTLIMLLFQKNARNFHCQRRCIRKEMSEVIHRRELEKIQTKKQTEDNDNKKEAATGGGCSMM